MGRSRSEHGRGGSVISYHEVVWFGSEVLGSARVAWTKCGSRRLRRWDISLIGSIVRETGAVSTLGPLYWLRGEFQDDNTMPRDGQGHGVNQATTGSAMMGYGRFLLSDAAERSIACRPLFPMLGVQGGHHIAHEIHPELWIGVLDPIDVNRGPFAFRGLTALEGHDERIPTPGAP